MADSSSEGRCGQMPSNEELGRMISVLRGEVKPETQAEKKFAPRDESRHEAKIHDALLDARFIFGAYEVQNCVGRIGCDYDGGGTGFRISNRLIMTAAHVFEKSKTGCITFHHYEPCLPRHPGNRISPDAKTFHLDPGAFYYENKTLDYAIIAIESKNPEALNDVGIISYYRTDILPGAHTNVFSYPGGNTMKVSLRKNVALSQGERQSMLTVHEGITCKSPSAGSLPPHVLVHEADTEGGSSGAPIFNDQWQLVAVHRAYASVDDGSQCFQGNIATLIRHILEDMYAPSENSTTTFEERLSQKNNWQQLGVPFEAYREELRRARTQ